MTTQTACAERLAADGDAPLALAFVVNGLSGSDETGGRIELLRRLMDADGRPYRVETIDEGHALADAVARAADWAVAQGGAVVASGGDGTLNAVAHAVLQAGCPMGVVPQGTFNYFARAHGIPTEPEAALRQLLASRAQPVQFGLMNEHIFLVNASLGLYPQLLQDREAFKRQFGRTRLNALIAALGTILREHRYWTLELDLSGKEWVVRTSTLFVGNNVLQLAQVGLPQSEAVAQGALAAVMVRPVGRLAMLGLALRGALGSLGDADSVIDFAFRRMTVRPARGAPVRRVRVAIDGEVLTLHTPLTFQVGPTPLMLLMPPPP
jgi:diacylglycerol kinase family enzyme